MSRINQNSALRFTFVLSFIAVTAFGSQLQTRISESFHHPVGAVPESWTVVSTGGEARAEITPPPVPVLVPGNGLLLQRTSRTSHNAAVYYTGSREAVKDGMMADFEAAVVITMQGLRGSSASGVVVRAQNLEYNDSDGYYICIGGEGTERGIAIFRNPDTHIYFHDRASAFTHIPEIRSGAGYMLKVSAKGEKITASLWILDEIGNAEEMLGETSIDDARTSPGLFGLRGSNGNSGPIGAWFRHLHLEVTE